MINSKYYQDITKFQSQFAAGIELTKDIKFKKKFNRVLVCGMGGSSLYVDLINDLLESVDEKVRLDVNRGYDLPSWVDNDTLVVLSSYSGNTEETISCYHQAKKLDSNRIVFASGGALLELATVNKEVYYQIPSGLQPRLSTGYYISGLVNILAKHGFLQNSTLLVQNIKTLQIDVDKEYAKNLAKQLVGFVPIIYATDNIGSIARVSKIKFNENSKIQAFYNVFPEFNHNEMVGFTRVLMKAYFIIFQSKFTHKRNNRRVEVFTKLMEDKGLDVEIVVPNGENITEEIFNLYALVDYVTYYLAEEYNIDPEPVKMVEDFKKELG